MQKGGELRLELPQEMRMDQVVMWKLNRETLGNIMCKE